MNSLSSRTALFLFTTAKCHRSDVQDAAVQHRRKGEIHRRGAGVSLLLCAIASCLLRSARLCVCPPRVDCVSRAVKETTMSF